MLSSSVPSQLSGTGPQRSLPSSIVWPNRTKRRASVRSYFGQTKALRSAMALRSAKQNRTEPSVRSCLTERCQKGGRCRGRRGPVPESRRGARREQVSRNRKERRESTCWGVEEGCRGRERRRERGGRCWEGGKGLCWRGDEEKTGPEGIAGEERRRGRRRKEGRRRGGIRREGGDGSEGHCWGGEKMRAASEGGRRWGWRRKGRRRRERRGVVKRKREG